MVFLIIIRIASPDEETIYRAARVCVEKVISQPLPLFRSSELAARARNWPSYLLTSFVLVASRFSPETIPGLTARDRLHCHDKVRRDLMIRLAEDNVHLEVLQCLCLLALEEIAGTYSQEHECAILD